jgi:hypothetical protein
VTYGELAEKSGTIYHRGEQDGAAGGGGAPLGGEIFLFCIRIEGRSTPISSPMDHRPRDHGGEDGGWRIDDGSDGQAARSRTAQTAMLSF